MTVEDKVKEIVEEHHCRGYAFCNMECDECRKNLADDLSELIEMVKSTKTERKGTVEELTQIFNDIIDTYDSSVIEKAYREAQMWWFD